MGKGKQKAERAAKGNINDSDLLKLTVTHFFKNKINELIKENT